MRQDVKVWQQLQWGQILIAIAATQRTCVYTMTAGQVHSVYCIKVGILQYCGVICAGSYWLRFWCW